MALAIWKERGQIRASLTRRKGVGNEPVGKKVAMSN